MGHRLGKYLAKQHEQRVNSQENKLYYQNGSEQSSPRSEATIRKHRTLDK